MDKFIIEGFTTDITTNSSSEIFTGIKHTLEAVREIIEEIFDWYNKANEDELEWGKWDNPTMDDCLTIELFSEKHLNDLMWYRGDIPDYPNTNNRVSEIINGKIEYKWVEKDNVEELMNEYRRNREIAEKKWKDITRPQLEGTVVISSVSDNTIPYDIIEKIKDTFICNRTHLG